MSELNNQLIAYQRAILDVANLVSSIRFNGADTVEWFQRNGQPDLTNYNNIVAADITNMMALLADYESMLTNVSIATTARIDVLNKFAFVSQKRGSVPGNPSLTQDQIFIADTIQLANDMNTVTENSTALQQIYFSNGWSAALFDVPEVASAFRFDGAATVNFVNFMNLAQRPFGSINYYAAGTGAQVLITQGDWQVNVGAVRDA